LAALYTQACEKRVEALENDLLEIADDTDRDYREGKNGKDILGSPYSPMNDIPGRTRTRGSKGTPTGRE
jgi:hypothetical protein